jgi:hypothetical protein
MSTSTDACLAFGVDMGEQGEYKFPWDAASDDWEDFEEWWAFECGITLPDVDYSDEAHVTYQAYWKRKSEAIKRCPVEMVRHCSDQCPMYILAVRGTLIEASRGYPVALDGGLEKNIDAKALKAFHAFCKQYGITLPAQPQWLLFSYWG